MPPLSLQFADSASLALILLLVGLAVLGAVITLRTYFGSYGPTSRTCLRCVYFEVDAAQAAIQRNHAFARITEVLSPFEIGKRTKTVDVPCSTCPPESKPYEGDGCPDCNGARVVPKIIAEYPSNVPASAKWSEYGWCTNENVQHEGGVHYSERLLWGGKSHCDGKLFQLRLRRKSAA